MQTHSKQPLPHGAGSQQGHGEDLGLNPKHLSVADDAHTVLKVRAAGKAQASEIKLYCSFYVEHPNFCFLWLIFKTKTSSAKSNDRK